MFPLTHVYVARQVLKTKNSLQTIGSIFPDAALLYGLDWRFTHCLGKELFEFIKNEQPELIPFALGLLTHGAEPKGLDYYGDECYGLNKEKKGYCFQKALPIINEVKNVCNLPAEFSWWKAHNFIEMAIEIQLAKNNPQLKLDIENAIDRYGKSITLNNTLKEFYVSYGKNVEVDLSRLRRFITTEEISSYSLSNLYTEQLWAKHRITGIDQKQVRSLIDFSAGLIEEDLEPFLVETIYKIKKMLIFYI